ncbi:hypothetical protein [Pseudomonas salmasensis]|uniref:AbiTii domain-containing protein n=1 Tax=Pseudomonas salmasensis TaxID=2745514 RepID=UPI00164654B4|nr:hypothetical protein [Pseudomonas salmasensis]QXH75626.1 hypothetical protein HU731_014200 [Pseudomonas salmasensis]
MDSLVLDLQRDALDRTISISDLLRKALMVSKKLKIRDIEEWLNHELNGYPKGMLPSYRILRGELKAFNPYAGWIPVTLQADFHDLVEKHSLYDSVSRITYLVEECKDESVIIKFPSRLNSAFMSLTKTDFQPGLQIPTYKLIGILDQTKTKVLEFALDLEERGILGEGVRFSKAEEQRAQSITYNTINIQRMENSQLQQATDSSAQRGPRQ